MDSVILALNFFCTSSNHMFRRAVWDKLPECIFENLEILKFSKITRGIYPKHVITGESHEANKHFVSKLIYFNSGQLKISERAIVNNTVNGAVLITINLVISAVITLSIICDFDQILASNGGRP